MDLSDALMVQLQASLECLKHRAGEGELAARMVIVSGTHRSVGSRRANIRFPPAGPVHIANAGLDKISRLLPAGSMTAMGQNCSSLVGAGNGRFGRNRTAVRMKAELLYLVVRCAAGAVGKAV